MQSAAFADLVAQAVLADVFVLGFEVLFFGETLDAVGVGDGELDISRSGIFGVDAAVDETQSVEMEVMRAGARDRSVGN